MLLLITLAVLGALLLAALDHELRKYLNTRP